MVDSADASMVSVDFDTSLREVELLSDEELYVKLKSSGKEVGPVVDTTRKLYQKQLANLMSSPNSSFYDSSLNSTNQMDLTNGTNTTENGFSDSDEEKVETSSRASRSSRGSTSTKVSKASDLLFTPRLRNAKEAEVKKNLVPEQFVQRRESRPKRTFEEYVAESEAKKAMYGNDYLRASPTTQVDEGAVVASKSTPLWQILLLVAVLGAIFAIVYISIMEKKLDQNSIIDREIEELTKNQ